MGKLLKLSWGQTPWDEMSREELLREIQKMYSAMNAARSALHLLSHNDPSPFWFLTGSGGRAMEKCSQALSRVDKYDSESLYRMFFRYADDLLFEDLGDDWVICDRCNGMRSSILPEGEVLVGTPCPDCKHKGTDSTLRKITWDDLDPKHGKDA